MAKHYSTVCNIGVMQLFFRDQLKPNQNVQT